MPFWLNLCFSGGEPELKVVFQPVYNPPPPPQAQAIVEELFPAGDSGDSLDSTLDRLVIGLSKVPHLHLPPTPGG